MTPLVKPADLGEISAQEAITATVHRTPGVHPKALADAMGVPYRQLLAMADPYQQRKLRAEEIPRLINGTLLLSGERNYLALDVIEQAVGRVAYVLPTASPKADVDLVARAGRLAKEFGDVLNRLPDVLDGEITADDAAKYRREWQELVAVGAELMAVIEARVVGPRVVTLNTETR